MKELLTNEEILAYDENVKERLNKIFILRNKNYNKYCDHIKCDYITLKEQANINDFQSKQKYLSLSKKDLNSKGLKGRLLDDVMALIDSSACEIHGLSYSNTTMNKIFDNYIDIEAKPKNRIMNPAKKWRQLASKCSPVIDQLTANKKELNNSKQPSATYTNKINKKSKKETPVITR